MLIIEIKKNDTIDRALKTLKSKVIKTKQNQVLNQNKEYTKDSVKRRNELLKAKYKEQKRKN